MISENHFLKKKDLKTLTCNPFNLIGDEWDLLTAGTPEHYNTMTASWGAMGVLWGKPTFHCFVRTNRYTLDFLNENDCFTVTFFDPDQHAALSYCGSHSGRDVDKAKETGLTPILLDGSTTFVQARSVFVCRKLYVGAIEESGFVLPETYSKWYDKEPLHRMFIGEITAYYERECE